MSLTLRINGEDRQIKSEPDTPLAYVLRDELKLKGTKIGCELEQCGACAVLVDGEAVLSCVQTVDAFVGRDITTVEGIERTSIGRKVQQAFIARSAAQCGYCTAGLVVAATALLLREETPARESVSAALTPHLCRCGSHPRVLQAVALASGQP